MTRALAAAALLLVLATASTALAGAYTYAGPRQWRGGEGASSYYSSTWLGNHFSTYGSGYDKVVTFIDNQQYAWFNTVRNRASVTETSAPYPKTVKGHCKAYDSYFWGSCWTH